MTKPRREFVAPRLSSLPANQWQPYSDAQRERIRAHTKHDVNGGSMERKNWDDPIWLAVLVEEVGEVARHRCEAARGKTAPLGDLREELIQVLAMTAAWVDAIDLRGLEAADA
jgi:NTP pyrophosphatase (non-canonical NTP hydrolase)